MREEEYPYKFDLTVCGREGQINMIEAAAREIKEDELEEALRFASKEISRLEEFQKKIAKEIGKAKRTTEKENISAASVALFNQQILPKMSEAIFAGAGSPRFGSGEAGKKKIDDLHTLWNNLVKEKFPDREDFSLEDNLFDDTENDILHQSAINENKRADGRAVDQVRDIYAQAGGLSSIIHGSGIFYRGGTHVLSVLTLGGPEAKHLIEGMEIKLEKRFMHHYNFPPFSAG